MDYLTDNREEMKMTTKLQQSEMEEARETLREMVKPGDTVQTILRHVSQSGMTRAISPVVDGRDVSYLVAKATGDKLDRRWDGIKMGGCGMDMGFLLVHGLSRALYPEYNCLGKDTAGSYRRCPSNTHVNPGPDRDNYSPDVIHTDGYAISHRWL